ncbi:MAG: archaetidylserine decarboxylase [Proteobacteria bacterium]|nr:archaetidylserine decarboxylase [Pseudomonadota bacterium]
MIRKLLMQVLPQNHLSYFVGKFVHRELPPVLAQKVIREFGNFYNINFDEAEKPVEEYRTLGEFFIRKLKPGLRPLAESPVLHPADSEITQIGLIRKGQTVWAKGKNYSIPELLGDEVKASLYEGGLWVTYYLCPTDYHRVHSPLDGSVEEIRHIPGKLWPVNSWSVKSVDDLFSVNERLVFHLQSRLGATALVMVGATNVGKMTTSLDESFVTNQLESMGSVKAYEPALTVKRGDEMGIFHMGSTVIMLYPKTIFEQKESWDSFLGQKVKMGKALL